MCPMQILDTMVHNKIHKSILNTKMSFFRENKTFHSNLNKSFNRIIMYVIIIFYLL